MKCKVILEIDGEQVKSEFNSSKKNIEKDAKFALDQTLLMVD